MAIPDRLRKILGIKTEEELNRVNNPKDKAKSFMKNILFAFIGAMIIKTFFLESSRVPTGSMESTIMTGDFLFVNKIIYGISTPRSIPFTDISLPFWTTPGLREPERKDIVVFEWPGNQNELKPPVIWTYVKRLVGLPGDTIKIKDKVVYVNGKEFWRPPHIEYKDFYLRPSVLPDSDIFPFGAKWNRDNYGPLAVPKKGEVITLDTSNIEQWRTIIDREFGSRVVDVEGDRITIDGIAANSYVLTKDYYFMLGDNRDMSLDSRYWGFVPREKIIGTPEFVYWSWDPSIPFSQPMDLLGSVKLDRIAKLLR